MVTNLDGGRTTIRRGLGETRPDLQRGTFEKSVKRTLHNQAADMLAQPNPMPNQRFLLASFLSATAIIGATMGGAGVLYAQDGPAKEAQATRQSDDEGNQPAGNEDRQPDAHKVMRPSQAYLGPVVAKMQLNLMKGEQILDTIHVGDLLTVLQQREDSLVIQTHSGHKGAVGFGNVAPLAKSSPVYDRLIARAPEDGRLYTLRAGAHYAAGEHEQALEDYDRAIELGYEEPHAYTSRGLFQAAMGRSAEALADFTKAIELDDDDAVALMNRASVYLATGKTDEAIEDYSTAIDLNPESSVLYNQRAVAHKVSGDYKAAIKDYDRALEINEQDVTSLLGRGFMRFQLAQHEEAIKDFTSVVELSPENAVALNNRGYNFQALGRESEAMEDFTKAIQLAPQYLLAIRNRAWLATLAKDIAVQDPAIAIETATAACEITEYKDFSDLLLLAAAHASASEFETAIGWQEKASRVADKQQLELSKKVLKLYQDEKPIDPRLLEVKQ
ncbi:MAG TPA: hypothetical protein DDW52_06960 [Planctomycetaceae bacterium]|nr:hypothetical protein [Planctomycetaceae bacterium]